ncbi:MAG: hypothetical protein V2I37_04300 [Marinilabiliaceae bacterium]|jgi:hypothetical protein|nr:hypothetical protein [Marinilabiliaceae bacterium]
MRKLVLLILLLFSSFCLSTLYGQLSLDILLSSFDKPNGEFPEYLRENSFKEVSQNAEARSGKWALLNSGANSKAELTIEIKTKPYKSIWIESFKHPVYYQLENEIIKRCEFRGFFGCSEVETWNSYWHSSGVEIRLIDLPESMETGLRIIELIEK